MKSVLLVAALLSTTAGAAFAELQSSPAVPEGLSEGEAALLDLTNRFSRDEFGVWRVGRGLVPHVAGQQAGAPDQFLQQASAPGRWLTDMGASSIGFSGFLVGAGAVAAAPEALAVGSIAPIVVGIDALNPWSGDGFWSRGSVGRGLVPNGGNQLVAVPGRWLTDGAKGTATWLGAAGGAVTALGGALGQAGVVAAGGELMTAGAGIAAAGDLVAGLDYVNPLSGDGIGSQGNVGRGFAGKTTTAPGRWLTDAADGLGTLASTTVGGAGAAYIGSQAAPVAAGGLALLGFEATAGAVAAAGEILVPAGIAAGLAGGLVAGIDALNPWSGDGVGSRGAAGRSLSPVPMMSPDPIVVLDTLNPWSGNGVGSPGVVGRGMVVPDGGNQMVAAPGRFITETAPGVFLNAGAAGAAAAAAAGATETAAAVLVAPEALAIGALPILIDALNPWSGDGFWSRGSVGRGLGVPGGVAGQMPYYSTGNAGMAPVQYDVGPQGTTISITIPNGYNVGQMGMMPMVPAMSTPQYRVIPQYAAPAPVAYAAPTMPANLAVAPAAANAGVKCQVGDQQAVAPTVDACEEAGGLVQPMDAAQPAE